MVDLVINERRREPRKPGDTHGRYADPIVPGARVLHVLDVSPHGLRCRLAQPVRPGRTMPLRLARAGGMVAVQAFVVRCEVTRLGRQSIQYEAAWSLDRPWLAE